VQVWYLWSKGNPVIVLMEAVENPREGDDEFYDVTLAATWSVSSAKLGNGVLQLLDDDETTCWQSDGSTPHVISATFPHRVLIQEVRVLVNHDMDESYTPARVGLWVLSGMDFESVGEIVELDQPKGWVHMQMTPVVGVFSLQVAILSNHQNGRDSHVRGIKVLGCVQGESLPSHSSIAFSKASVIR